MKQGSVRRGRMVRFCRRVRYKCAANRLFEICRPFNEKIDLIRQIIVFYYDGRFAIPAKLMFWGNILFPAITLLWSGFWLIRKRKTGVSTLLPGLLVCTVLNTVMAAMKRFVKCFFELLTQIIVKVRKCKVQRVCVLHFQLAGSGGCFFLMKLYH